MAITIKKQETVNHMLYGLTFTLNQYSNTRPTFSIHNNNELTTILTSDHLILCNASIGGCIGPRLLYNKIIWRCRILNHKVITRVISTDCLLKIEAWYYAVYFTIGVRNFAILPSGIDKNGIYRKCHEYHSFLLHSIVLCLSVTMYRKRDRGKTSKRQWNSLHIQVESWEKHA